MLVKLVFGFGLTIGLIIGLGLVLFIIVKLGDYLKGVLDPITGWSARWRKEDAKQEVEDWREGWTLPAGPLANGTWKAPEPTSAERAAWIRKHIGEGDDE
jgi:hypothetical protein